MQEKTEFLKFHNPRLFPGGLADPSLLILNRLRMPPYPDFPSFISNIFVSINP